MLHAQCMIKIFIREEGEGGMVHGEGSSEGCLKGGGGVGGH